MKRPLSSFARVLRTSGPASSLLAAVTLAVSAPVAGAQADSAAERFREFTNREGKTMKASIQSKTDIAVTLKREDGIAFTLPIADFSDSDQDYIQRWDPLQEKFRREFGMLSVRQLLEARGYQSFEYYIEGNHIFVDGELNGKPMRFMIDTGAGSTTLDVNAATEAGLEIGDFTEIVYGIGGQAPAAPTDVPSIRIGEALITNRKLLSVDLFKDMPNPSRNYGAIFGADFLRELDAVISYKENRVFLKPD